MHMSDFGLNRFVLLFSGLDQVEWQSIQLGIACSRIELVLVLTAEIAGLAHTPPLVVYYLWSIPTRTLQGVGVMPAVTSV
jgi:hypothetical protein